MEEPDENFFRFREILKTIKKKIISAFDTRVKLKDFSEKLPELFGSLSEGGCSLLEEILRCPDERSAKFISLIWEDLELWRAEMENCILPRKGSSVLPIAHVLESKNTKNLLSFLVFDWHNLKTSGNEKKNYNLSVKNQQLITLTGESLFQKLYEIIDSGRAYHDVCLRIMFECLSELKEEDEDKKAATPNLGAENRIKTVYLMHKKEKLISMASVLKMKNEESKRQILALLLTHWNFLPQHFFTEFMDWYEQNKSSEVNFFSLALQLIAKEQTQFEENFKIFVAIMKRRYGHFHETAINPNARLLSKIAKTQRMFKVEKFIYNKCPSLELVSSPQTNFKEMYQFNNKNMFPMNKQEKALLVSGLLFL